MTAHIAWAFVPMESVTGQIVHFVGRLAGPAMACFLAEGYRRVSPDFWVIYTLLLSLLATWLWDKGKCRTMQGRLRRIYRQSRSKAGTLSYRVHGIPAVACVYSISDFSGVTWMNSPALRRAGRSAK